SQSIADAIKALEPAAQAHKSRDDLSSAISGLKQIQQLDAEAQRKYSMYNSAYQTAQLKLSSTLMPANAKSTLDSLKNLTNDTVGRIIKSAMSNVAAEAQSMANAQRALLDAASINNETMN